LGGGVNSLADIFDSRAGLLLVPDEDGRLTLQARWNWATADVPSNCVTSQTMPFFESTGHIVSMDEVRAGSDERCDPRAIPQWLYDEAQAWAVVPLVHFGKLAGLVILARPRLPRAALTSPTSGTRFPWTVPTCVGSPRCPRCPRPGLPGDSSRRAGRRGSARAVAARGHRGRRRDRRCRHPSKVSWCACAPRPPGPEDRSDR